MSTKDISRRGFLVGAGVLGAGAAVGLSGCSSQGGKSSSSASGGATKASDAMTSEQYLGTWSFEVPPEAIPDSKISEVINAEVIVVGSGTSGLVAANSALDSGLDVCLITASTIPIARGGSNQAMMSKTKEKFGLAKGDPMLFEREIINNGMCIDQKKWFNFYNNSEEAMNWLIDIMEAKGYETGLEQEVSFLKDGNYFSLIGAHGFMTEEEHTMGMNQPFVVAELAARLEQAGKPVHFSTIARQLVREQNNTGRVTAVIAELDDGSYVKYEGSKAIILATGDFSANRDMMNKYAPYAAQIISDTVFDGEVDYDRGFEYGGLYPGDGQRMGLWIGAAWQKLWPCCPMGGGIGVGPSNGTLAFSGLRVNRDGQRFMNEYGVRDMAGYTNRIQPGGVVSAIWNAKYATEFPFSWINRPEPYGSPKSTLTPEAVLETWNKNADSGTFFKADTIEELIELMELPPETIATVARYNELCATGADTDFYKETEFMIPLDEGPFYGQTADTPLFLTILGGLRTNENMQVCDADDMPIPGLYNVGTMTGDMYSVNYTFQIPGLNLGATCVTFGYMTGKHIAANE